MSVSEHDRPWFAEDEAKLLTGLTNSRCVDNWSQFLNVLCHHLDKHKNTLNKSTVGHETHSFNPFYDIQLRN